MSKKYIAVLFLALLAIGGIICRLQEVKSMAVTPYNLVRASVSYDEDNRATYYITINVIKNKKVRVNHDTYKDVIKYVRAGQSIRVKNSFWSNTYHFKNIMMHGKVEYGS